MDGVLEADGDSACLLRAGAASLEVLVIHVLMPGFEFEVVAPSELDEWIRSLRDRLSRAVDRSAR